MPGLFRDTDEFSPTLDAAAEKLGVGATAVEKDYWVTQVLRALADGFVDDVVFKGGTSQSKGFGLIERFSEDIDILIVAGDRGSGATDTLMRAMANDAAASIGGAPTSYGGAERGRHRAYEIPYPVLRPATELIQPRVLLEMGVRGGDHPKQKVSMGTLVGDALTRADVDISTYADLADIELWVLHPGRTLLEKLATVHLEARRLSRDHKRTPDPRIGRHFYDIYQLLDDTDTMNLLEDRVEVDRVLDEIAAVTRRYFAQPDEDIEPVPAGGFRSSPAFDPTSPAQARLRDSYEATMPELYFGSGPLPSWEQILERVASAPI
jgi:hypothetical protein